MRLLALTTLLALVGAQEAARCSSDIPNNTLWIAGDRAYTCAPFKDTTFVGKPGNYCISTRMDALEGGADRCRTSADCGTGICALMDSRKVCWKLTWGGKCANPGE
ncbi:uncharacterized protein DNG_06683 [Cephalotrichum gorgonifer]|uniref:Uncharacterized protein n=1 Tax=Cephalotrichum gorgonifer TaxID=2041049 RepID=A0AAE8N367_9PEZI|nr:uncharacterized protein DNG_06683 [Cephalotrichum gorgonifer]